MAAGPCDRTCGLLAGEPAHREVHEAESSYVADEGVSGWRCFATSRAGWCCHSADHWIEKVPVLSMDTIRSALRLQGDMLVSAASVLEHDGQTFRQGAIMYRAFTRTPTPRVSAASDSMHG